MAYSDSIVAFASDEEGVNWKQNESRILDYFQSATGRPWRKSGALTISWCTYFVMWVLKQSKMDPMPKVGTRPPKDLSTGRFIKSVNGASGPGNATGSHSYWGVYDAFTVASKQYTPKAGDLFYLPSFNDHIGIVVEALGNGQVVTMNGNSGPAKGEGFDARFESSAQIGSGFVFRKVRDLLDGKPMYVGACWIQTPD